VSCPFAELPVPEFVGFSGPSQSATYHFLSPAWWWQRGEGGVGMAGWGRRGGEGGGGVLERKIRLIKSECNVDAAEVQGIALATSIVKAGEATALRVRNTLETR
jgi:hypothetical protein